MFEEGSKERPEVLDFALQLLQQNSQIPELTQRLMQEKQSVATASEALTKILTGGLTESITLDQTASKKLLVALTPKNFPGLISSREWKYVTYRGSAQEDGAWSGSRLNKIVFNGNVSYLLEEISLETTISLILSQEPPFKPVE